MNDIDLSGPCAGYEFEIVELHEGALGAERARQIRAHLDGCARCRGWQARYATLDAALARELPRPELSSDFAAMLHERLAGIDDPTARRSLRMVAEREHDSIVVALKHAARRRAVIGSATGAAVAAAGLALAVALGPETAAVAQGLGAGNSNAALIALGSASVVGALAWSAMRGVLPGVRLPG